jgi:hypothetical protein
VCGTETDGSQVGGGLLPADNTGSLVAACRGPVALAESHQFGRGYCDRLDQRSCDFNGLVMLPAVWTHDRMQANVTERATWRVCAS